MAMLMTPGMCAICATRKTGVDPGGFRRPDTNPAIRLDTLGTSARDFICDQEVVLAVRYGESEIDEDRQVHS